MALMGKKRALMASQQEQQATSQRTDLVAGLIHLLPRAGLQGLARMLGEAIMEILVDSLTSLLWEEVLETRVLASLIDPAMLHRKV